MKTLIFFGSARKNGHTKQMLDVLTDQLDHEFEIIDAYNTHVSPCKDCRFCWHKKNCAIKDDMQEIYKKIEEANNIVFASPMYFHTVTGPLKIIIDRLQVYWASHVRKDKPDHFLRKGAIIMVGGAPDFDIQFDAGNQVLSNVLKDLDSNLIGSVTLSNSDRDSIESKPFLKDELKQLAQKLNIE
ncbi:flavodoxin family protein [Oceanotoga sp. DSM 15011]|jgi:multimeric flavodoxin WrbA|uniref:NADPH-dependent FMN reductase n=1 Tax=Oceanotoga teriensis TaxID=515440 RepID=A0AA45HHL2_9BACT|nr:MULTISPECIES: flavodoxin family protein [Oceanotoga]MDN5341887.1 hypothetical protein [Oceanotoga sp.]PWJ86120.1 NADPH-dependent FMN reductase [Oceanotoga teriensis]UYP00721.1 flavodoxin family protein [Oceanotoga sp. DSM 15011]